MDCAGAEGCFAAIIPGRPTICASTQPAPACAHSARIPSASRVPKLGLNATRSHIQPPPGRLALVSQSSAISRAVIDWAEPNGVGFSHIVGVGDNHDIGYGMVLDWLSRDPDTGAILLDVRRIKNHRLFLSAARAAAKLRPVVAIRAGLRTDERGRRRRPGVRGRVATRRRAVRQPAGGSAGGGRDPVPRPPVRSDTLAIVSTAIGPGRLARDAVLRAGLDLCPTKRSTSIVHVARTGPRPRSPLAARPDVGGVLVMHAPDGSGGRRHHRQPDREASATARADPVLRDGRDAPARCTGPRLIKAGLPVFATPDQAVRGFEHLVQDRRNRAAARELPPSTVLTVAPDSGLGAAHLRPGPREGRPGADPGRVAGRAVRLWRADGADPRGLRPGRCRRRGGPASAIPPSSRCATTPGREPGRRGGLVLDLLDAAACRTAAQLLAARDARRAGPARACWCSARPAARANWRSAYPTERAFGPTISSAPAAPRPTRWTARSICRR